MALLSQEDQAKIDKMFFLRVNSSAFAGLTDCIRRQKNSNMDQTSNPNYYAKNESFFTCANWLLRML